MQNVDLIVVSSSMVWVGNN